MGKFSNTSKAPPAPPKQDPAKEISKPNAAIDQDDAADDAAAKLAAQEEAKRLAAEEEAKRLAAEEEAKRLAAEDAARVAEEEAAERAAQDAAARIAKRKAERDMDQQRRNAAHAGEMPARVHYAGKTLTADIQAAAADIITGRGVDAYTGQPAGAIKADEVFAVTELPLKRQLVVVTVAGRKLKVDLT